MKKLENKTYISRIEEEKDSFGNPYYVLELPQELLDSLGWVENDYLTAEVKLGEVGNVIVVKKSEIDQKRSRESGSFQ